MKAIREKELENQFLTKQKEIESSIVSIKKDAAREVLVRRNKLKKIIEQMRKKQKRKTIALSQELQAVKSQMAEQMGKVYKKGNLENCIKIGNGIGNIEKIEMRKNYCVANFSEEYVTKQGCIEDDDFCKICCNNEFGEFHIEDREKCYSSSCNDTAVESKSEKSAKNREPWKMQESIDT